MYTDCISRSADFSEYWKVVKVNSKVSSAPSANAENLAPEYCVPIAAINRPDGWKLMYSFRRIADTRKVIEFHERVERGLLEILNKT